jgi:uncharacterized membrane protein
MKRKLIKVLILLGGIVGFIYIPYLVGISLYPQSEYNMPFPAVYVAGLANCIFGAGILVALFGLGKLIYEWVMADNY